MLKRGGPGETVATPQTLKGLGFRVSRFKVPTIQASFKGAP